MPDGQQALVLDFGSVITRTLLKTHTQSEKALGLPRGTLTWRQPFDPDKDPLWRSMQADGISKRDFWHARTIEVAKLVSKG